MSRSASWIERSNSGVNSNSSSKRDSIGRLLGFLVQNSEGGFLEWPDPNLSHTLIWSQTSYPEYTALRETEFSIFRLVFSSCETAFSLQRIGQSRPENRDERVAHDRLQPRHEIVV
jgi:hypothetical protein